MVKSDTHLLNCCIPQCFFNNINITKRDTWSKKNGSKGSTKNTDPNQIKRKIDHLQYIFPILSPYKRDSMKSGADSKTLMLWSWDKDNPCLAKPSATELVSLYTWFQQIRSTIRVMCWIEDRRKSPLWALMIWIAFRESLSTIKFLYPLATTVCIPILMAHNSASNAEEHSIKASEKPRINSPFQSLRTPPAAPLFP